MIALACILLGRALGGGEGALAFGGAYWLMTALQGDRLAADIADGDVSPEAVEVASGGIGPIAGCCVIGIVVIGACSAQVLP